NTIRLGLIEWGIAGGVDTTSDAPIAIGSKLRKKLLEVNRQRDLQGRLKVLAKIRPGDISIDAPANKEPRTGKSMGGHTAETAATWGITREAQDQLTLESHEKLAAAYDRGFFDDLITPYKGLERDANLRPGGSLEKLGKLKPVFGGPEGTMTAANSTPLSDGASVVLFGSEAWAKERDLTVLAYFIDGETAAVDYVGGKEGLLLAPIYAVPRLLARNDLTLQDLDLYEIHEAFAAQTLATLKAWEDADFCKKNLGLAKPLGAIDRSKLNVNGGSLAAGHPFAATGGRLIAGLAKELHARGGGTGLISVCAAGGLGVTALVSTDPTLGSKS
ncbi:MAG: acetyl-CoA C-acyltransferase, partial [Patulibacter sp.]